MKTTKKSLVLKHLQEYGSITSLQAYDLYGATRLSSIIFDLKKEGHNIMTKDLNTLDHLGNKCTFANYMLISNEQSADTKS